MSIKIQQEVPAIILLTALLCIFSVILGKKMRKFAETDVFAKPTGLVFVGLTIVELIEGMVSGVMGKKSVQKYGAYICTLAMYLLCANLSGLFGFSTPTMNLSVNLALAGITWLLIEGTNLKTNGVGGYLHSLIEPMPFFIFGNIISKFSPLVSLSMRLFGNILSGSILMSLVYMATGNLSNLLLGWIGDFNIFGILLAPILHIYFDVFSGCIQMYIFVSLTMAFVGNQLGE